MNYGTGSRLRFYLGGIFVLLILNFTCRRAHSQQTPTPPAAGSTSQQQANPLGPKLVGEFRLTTNFIERGLSFSNNSMAMQPEIGYQWPNAKVGLWGSNVQFPNSNENLNLRLYGWYKIIFAGNNDLKFKIDISKFFSSNYRNAEIVLFDLNMNTHHFIIDSNPNWFGTGNRGTWLGYEKDWKVFWGLDYKLSSGYTMISGGPYSGFFDVKTGFGYKYTDLYYELLFNFNSGSGQFSSGIGDMALYLQLGAQF